MKPPKSIFACTECGAQSPKWLGRCPDCGAWNSFVEEHAAPAVEARGAVPALGGRGSRLYQDVEVDVAQRISTGISEFDRVLGGGIVPGSLVLLGGEPGIGKSTLLLQAAAHLAASSGRCCTARARNPNIRSSCAASGSASVRRRSTCWPRPASSG